MTNQENGPTPRKILLPLDGSERADEALSYVKMLAQRLTLEVRLLRCYEPPETIYSLPELGLYVDSLGDQRLRQLLEAGLEERRGMLEGILSSASVECIDAASGILGQAREFDLVVMSSHGRGSVERWLLGSVTTKVARACHKPVLVVAGQTGSAPRLETVMVCLDGSPSAEAALREALKLTAAFGARLIAYRFASVVYRGVSNEMELKEAESYLHGIELAHPGRIAMSIARETDGRPFIVETAREQKVDLVVVGRRGYGAFTRWIMGSVAEQVLHHAPCPVLVVH